MTAPTEPTPPISPTPSTPSGPHVPLGAATPTTPWQRRRWTREVWLVLGVSLLGSAVYSVLVLVDRYTVGVPLADQSAALNPVLNPRPWLDLLYQLRRYVFLALPAFLALYLLTTPALTGARRMGLDLRRPGRDAWHGLALAACVGLPGLAYYGVTRLLGLTVQVQPATLAAVWWAPPMLVIGAVANAVLEEVVIVGYLAERLRDLRWGAGAIIVASALLRGCYHLYQGPGMAVGNVAMGVLFAAYYLLPRWGGRVMPLVVAHTVIDSVAFVGYALVPASWLTALGLS